MHQSIPSLTIPRPWRGPWRFTHSSCTWGQVFVLLSCPGVCPGGSSIKVKVRQFWKKNAIFAFSLKQLSSSSFHMFIYAKREQCDSGSIWQGIRIYPGKLKPVLVKLKFHLIQDVNMANMPKKTKLYSRFLLLRIYPDSPVHMTANMERIQICPVML